MKKLKILSGVGTRPEIIHLSRVLVQLDLHCAHVLGHTGENYDYDYDYDYDYELKLERVSQGLAILATQSRGNARNDPHGIRQVGDYSMPNVSDKVVRIVHSYTDYVNRVIWKKY